MSGRASCGASPDVIQREFELRRHVRKKCRRLRLCEGHEVAALFYTMTESAKLAAVDAHAYMMAAAHAALRRHEPLLPHVFRQRLRSARDHAALGSRQLLARWYDDFEGSTCFGLIAQLSSAGSP